MCGADTPVRCLWCQVFDFLHFKNQNQKADKSVRSARAVTLGYNCNWVSIMPLPQTEAPGRLQAELMSRGLRMTRQRRTILSVVETAKQHLDASQILRHARRLDPQIDRVTVYRTLGLLKRHGLVDELDLMHMQGEKHYYERRPQRDHIHMACLRCGKILEFESDLFERLKGQIQRDCHFHIVVSRLEVGGYCSKCRTASPP